MLETVILLVAGFVSGFAACAGWMLYRDTRRIVRAYPAKNKEK